MPSATVPPTLTAKEDAALQGLVVNLTYYDFEPQTPTSAVITMLPSEGTLYQTTGGVQGKTLRIDAVHNIYDLGTGILDQYLHKVTKVSSFWGAAPDAGYHALGILGAPDTNSYGEGRNDAAWVTQVSMPLLRTAHALRMHCACTAPLSGGIRPHVPPVSVICATLWATDHDICTALPPVRCRARA